MSDPSEFAPAMANRPQKPQNAEKNNQTSTAPPADDAARTPYRKRTRFRFHEHVQELSTKALWKQYITARFDDLYAQHLKPFRLAEDTPNKRSILKHTAGYTEAHNAFKRAKKAFIKRLVEMEKEAGGELKIDEAARKYLEMNGN